MSDRINDTPDESSEDKPGAHNEKFNIVTCAGGQPIEIVHVDDPSFWKSDVLRTDDDTEVQAITLLDENGRDCEVLSIHRDGDMVVFTEQCDSWNDVRLTKPQAITALKQAIEWIERQR